MEDLVSRARAMFTLYSIRLEQITTTSPQSGHRDNTMDHIAALSIVFLDGRLGLTHSCGVQILEGEEDGQRLLDDGLFCVCALPCDR